MNTLVSVCGFGVFHLIGVPAWIGYSSMQNYAGLPLLFGIPQPYIVSHGKFYKSIPKFFEFLEIFDLTFPYFPTFDHSTIFQRTVNFWNRLRLDFFVTEHMWTDEDELFQQRFSNFPPLNKLYAQMSYAFLGTSPILDRPRPITGKIKYLGGVHKDVVKPLPEVCVNTECLESFVNFSHIKLLSL